MILTQEIVDPAELERRTGWAIKQQGACKGEICVPLPRDEPVTVGLLAERLGMPVVRDEQHGLLALGPDSLGRALASVEAPDLVLPDRAGEPFALRSLRGMKVFLLAWASW